MTDARACVILSLQGQSRRVCFQQPSCESGVIGSRARLRTVSRKGWGFESPLSHQLFSDVPESAFLNFIVKDARAVRLTLSAGFKIS
jgi:hypothetical protein